MKLTKVSKKTRTVRIIKMIHKKKLQVPREEGDIGLFITLVLKVLQLRSPVHVRRVTTLGTFSEF